jgi:hypothetical protein
MYSGYRLHGASGNQRKREMRPQQTPKSLALIVAASVFTVFISAQLTNTCHRSSSLARGYDLLTIEEDQGIQPCYEDLLRSLNTALISWSSIAFSIAQPALSHPVSALFHPFDLVFDLSIRAPPHPINA